MTRVAWLTVAPEKGLAHVHRDEVLLEREGVRENRRFHIVDETGRRFGLLRHGPLALVQADWDELDRRLALTFPDGTRAEGTVELGDAVTTDFYGRPAAGHEVVGPWNEALSAYAGRPVRLIEADDPAAGVDRGKGGAISVISQASLDALARRAGEDAVDARRFRMLIGVDGCAAHEEDEWIGRDLRAGEATLRVSFPVERCAATKRNPDSGEIDLDTLNALRDTRGSLDLGVAAAVVERGVVRVGDSVEPA